MTSLSPPSSFNSSNILSHSKNSAGVVVKWFDECINGFRNNNYEDDDDDVALKDGDVEKDEWECGIERDRRSSLALSIALHYVTYDYLIPSFHKDEPLGPDDMWYWPGCKEQRQVTKKLDLWRTPDIIVFHLKRFSYSLFLKNKLDT
ncbi:ubiquitin carboxyl-terminal hydrolase 9 [Tanacetum coccineum]